MQIRIHLLLGQAALCAALAAVTSCTRPSPVSPVAPSPAAVGTTQHAVPTLSGPPVKGMRAIPVDATAFPLLAGSFAIRNEHGNGISGTYTGTALVADGGGAQRSSLSFQISSGSGAFAGAAGTMTIRGSGSLTGEGEFLLDGDGEITLADGRRALVVLNLAGSSRATCSTAGRIAISGNAAGTMGRAGRVTATLSHEVGNTGCTS